MHFAVTIHDYSTWLLLLFRFMSVWDVFGSWPTSREALVYIITFFSFAPILIISFSHAQISSLKVQLEVLLGNLSNLTTRVESLESGPDKYIKLEFELLRIELREFEALVTQLKASLNSSSPAFESLYIEVKPPSLTQNIIVVFAWVWFVFFVRFAIWV